MSDKKRVLFVCLGNICRSPMAEAVFLHRLTDLNLAQSLDADSAGTASYHEGGGADTRTVKTLSAHGVPINHVARKVRREDFSRFDLILAMDSSNYSDLLPLAGSSRDKLKLFRDFDPVGKGDVPDPYYGGQDGFEEVFEMCSRSVDGIIEYLNGLDDFA